MSMLGEDVIKKMAVELVQNAADYAIDMMSFDPDEYRTYDEVARCIENSVTLAEDIFLEDQIKFFIDKLTYHVKNAKVIPGDISFTREGFKDADFKIQMAEK